MIDRGRADRSRDDALADVGVGPRYEYAPHAGRSVLGGFSEAVEDARAVGLVRRFKRDRARAVADDLSHRGGEDPGRLLKLGPGVRGHDGQPKAGGSFGNRRGPDRLREYPLVEG